jgi:hypothetical protein
MQRVHANIENEQYEQLRKLAYERKAHDKTASVSKIIRQAIDAYLEKQRNKEA